MRYATGFSTALVYDWDTDRWVYSFIIVDQDGAALMTAGNFATRRDAVRAATVAFYDLTEGN